MPDTRLNPSAIYIDFSSLSHACCACITKLHVGLLKLHFIVDTVVHKSVIATIKHGTAIALVRRQSIITTILEKHLIHSYE